MKSKIIILILMLIFVSGCSKKEKNIEEKVIPVTTQKVELTKLSIPIESSGKVGSSTETVLSFKTGGIIRKIYVDEGDNVRKGEILAELNLSEINAKVNQANAALEKAKRDLSRIESLYKDSVVTLEQFQNVKTAYDVANANYDAAKFNLEHSKIIAPAKGTIYRKTVEENEVVGPGNPILIIGTNDNSWIIKSSVTDKDISKLSLGDTVKIFLDAFPGRKFYGNINQIGRAANPYTGAYPIEISVKSNDKKIVSGMIANIEITPSQKYDCYLIPIQAIVNVKDNSAYIFTVSPDRKFAKRINVRLNGIFNDEVIVKSDSQKFNEVILDGVEYLSNNQKINIIDK